MAEEQQVFENTIRAVDEASGPIGKILGQMGGLGRAAETLGAHAKGMGHALQTAFGEAEHAAKHAGPHIEHAAHPHVWMALAGHAQLFRGHLGAISASLGEVGRSFTEFLPALAGLSVGGGLVGLFETVEKVSDSFSELNKSAIKAGVSVAAFQELSFAAKMTDVSVDSLQTSLFRLNRVIADSEAGKNKNALSLFHHLGIELRDATGHMVSADKILPELAEAFQKTTDPAMRARMAMALFGKAGAEMLPLLTLGKEELAEFSRRADELVYPFSDADKKNLEGYHQALGALGTAVGGFANELGAKLAPVLRPVVDLATEWVAKNRDWIATGIVDKVAELADWVSKLDLKEIILDTGEWARRMAELADRFGGARTIIGAFGLVAVSPALIGLGAISATVGTLGRALVAVGAIMWANPVLDAIGLLAVAGYLLWQYWDKVADFFHGMLQRIAAAFQTAWADIKPIIDAMKSSVDFVQNGWVGRQIGGIVSAATPQGIILPDGLTMPPLGGLTMQPQDTLGSLYPQRQSAATAAPAANGTVRTEIVIKNLPPGSTVSTQTRGNIAAPDVDVGYGLAGMAGAY